MAMIERTSMKALFLAVALLLPSLGWALPITIPYTFVSLSGDHAQGSAPLSQTDYTLGSGPNYGAGDRSNDPFTFSFNTEIGLASYLDYFGFGFTLSEDKNQLFANGSIVQLISGVGFFYASFLTGLDGITSWNGSLQAGGQTYSASGSGKWLKEGFSPTAVQVPEGGVTALLLGLPLAAIFWISRRRRN